MIISRVHLSRVGDFYSRTYDNVLITGSGEAGPNILVMLLMCMEKNGAVLLQSFEIPHPLPIRYNFNLFRDTYAEGLEGQEGQLPPLPSSVGSKNCPSYPSY